MQSKTSLALLALTLSTTPLSFAQTDDTQSSLYSEALDLATQVIAYYDSFTAAAATATTTDLAVIQSQFAEAQSSESALLAMSDFPTSAAEANPTIISAYAILDEASSLFDTVAGSGAAASTVTPAVTSLESAVSSAASTAAETASSSASEASATASASDSASASAASVSSSGGAAPLATAAVGVLAAGILGAVALL